MPDNNEKTLAEQVFACVSADQPTPEAEEHVELVAKMLRQEPSDGAALTRREDDLRDWGFLYGLAYAMAGEGDRRPIRALDAARAAYGRWAGQIHHRPVVSPLVDDVIVAYGNAEKMLYLVALKDPERHDLAEAMHELIAAVGEPAPKGGE